MVGKTRQQRSAGHVGDRPRVLVEATFVADRPADIRNRGILASAGEVQQDAVPGEIADVRRLEFLDRGEVATIEERDPVIIGAHMHAPLVGADRGGNVVGRRRFRRLRQVEIAGMFAVRVHCVLGPHFPPG